MIKWEKDRVIVVPKALTEFEMPRNLREMQKIGNIAAQIIFNRITKKGEDGYGAKLPKLKKSGWFFTSAYDGRFGSKLKKIRGNRAKGTKTIQIFGGGYGELKKAIGAKNKRDGACTGEMWRNLKPKLKERKGFGWDIVLQFGGSQKVGKKATGRTKTLKRPRKVKKSTWKNQHGEGWEMVKITEVPVLKTVSIKNRTKARELQKVNGRWAFSLLSLSAEEQELIMGIWLKLIKKKNAGLRLG